MKYSAAVARRGASASPLSCRASTPAPNAHNDGLAFPRRNRLTRSTDVQTVIHEGKRIRTVHLDVRVIASPLEFPRVGIVVPRHRRSAVDRNRLKRRLREMVRIELLPALRERPAVDLAIRARREAYGADVERLRADVIVIRSRVTDDSNST